MNLMKTLFMEAYEELYSEAMDSGEPINEDNLADPAHKRSIDRFAEMCDAAKDRGKYE